MSFAPFLVTLKLALITTVVLLLVAIPIAYWLTYSKSKIRFFAEALVALPLILPPTVLGYYLLIAFSPNGALGGFLNSVFDIQLAFSFPGLVIASVIYSLPFMVHPIQSGLQQLPPNYKEASYTLGKSRIQTLFKVLLPAIKGAVITGIVLSFAHTIGEFGVVLMIGGNIEETRVASIAIYDEVNKLNYDTANLYSAILLGFSFLVLLVVYAVNRSGMRQIYR